MLIEIVSDTVCPWCYIGKRRLESALSMRPGVNADLRWRPYQLNPTMPKEGIDRDSYLAARFGTLERAERAFERLRASGVNDRIDFRFSRIRHTPNSMDSHRLIRHSEPYGVQKEIVEALYAAYFQEGQDIGDIEVLSDIAAEHGLDRGDTHAYLAGDADRAQIASEDERFRQLGITGVPCYVIDDRYAVSGAQSPEVFVQVIDLARHEETSDAFGFAAAE